MISFSTFFVNASLPHLLSKLAVIVFCEVGVEGWLNRYKFVFLGGIEIICKDISINLWENGCDGQFKLLKGFGQTCKWGKCIDFFCCPIYQNGIYCYILWVGSTGEKLSQLCTDSCHKQVYSWREYYFSTYEMRCRLVKFPFSVCFMFPRFKVCFRILHFC